MRIVGRLEVFLCFITLILFSNIQPTDAADEFTVKRVVFINGASKNFGDYLLKSTNLFEEGDNLSLYFEPLTCSFTKMGAGFQAQIEGKATLSSTSNSALTQTLELGKMDFLVPDQHVPMYADITLMDVGNLPIDLYKLEMTFTDFVTRQTFQFTKLFRVGPSYIQAIIAASAKEVFDPKVKTFPLLPADSSRIYCIFKTRRIQDGTMLKSISIAESVEGLPRDEILETYTTEVKRFQQSSFVIECPQEKWLAGDYRLELYLDDVFEIALFFRVL